MAEPLLHPTPQDPGGHTAMRKTIGLLIATLMLIGGLTVAGEGIAHAAACGDGLGQYLNLAWDSGAAKPYVSGNCTGYTDSPATGLRLKVGCSSFCHLYLQMEYNQQPYPTNNPTATYNRTAWYTMSSQDYDSTGAFTGSHTYPGPAPLPNAVTYGDVRWIIYETSNTGTDHVSLPYYKTYGAVTALSNFGPWYMASSYTPTVGIVAGFYCGATNKAVLEITGQPPVTQLGNGTWSFNPYATVQAGGSTQDCGQGLLSGRTYIKMGADDGTAIGSRIEALCVDENTTYNDTGHWNAVSCVDRYTWFQNTKNWPSTTSIVVADTVVGGVHMPAQKARIRVVLRFEPNYMTHPPHDQNGVADKWEQEWCSTGLNATGGCAVTNGV